MAEDDQDIAARIERLFVIPSKSCAGFELEASVLRATGLEFPAAGVERFRPNVLLSGLEAHDEERLDAIGGGASSSPRDGLGVDFPRYTIRDMVRAQHHLVSHELNLPGLLATGGSSMGAFQALEWGILYPDFVKGLLLLVPAAKAPNNFKAVVDAMIEVIKLDPAWQGGRYARNPSDGLWVAGMVFGTWFVSDAYLELQNTEASYRDALTIMSRTYATWDATSWMWRYLASRDHDVSQPFGGDMKKALRAVRAKALIMPSSTDRVLPPFCAHELRDGLPDQRYVEIPSVMGHMAQNPGDVESKEHRFVGESISEFLSQL